MDEFTRKIGQNKGKPRLWLEGKILSDHGFRHGDMWQLLENFSGGLIIERGLTVAGTRKRKIAGSPERPIIDIAGNSLADLQDAKIVTIEAFDGQLFVRKES